MPEPDTTSDRALVAAANRGEAAAFETLYARYRNWVYTLAYRFCGDAHEANDVLQDTFFYFFNKFPGFELRAQIKTFLYPAVRNLALGRRKKQARFVPLDALAQEPAGQAPRDPNAERHAILELVAQLPEQQREVLLLRYADGLDLADIADALYIPLGTAKSRLHNAMKRLRGTVLR